jgi:ectoine hydroxylase-related dioxygenase (phytanoyl-CoA dioxygenase family)
MQIGDWESSKDLNELYREIRSLGLEQQLAELDNFGFTVVPPEKIAPPEFVDHLRDAVLRVSEQRTGVPADLETGASHAADDRPMHDFHWMLFEDPIFEEALLNPVGLALSTYLVGASCALSISTGLIKGPGPHPFAIHCDNNGHIPAPFPPYAQMCNITWLLSDYCEDNGALCFVPGSHKWGRYPTPPEATDFGRAVPVEAPPGSLVAWGGNMWHGAFARKAPGLRIALVFAFARPYMRPAQPYEQHVTKEMLDRNPPRFAKLMGQDNWMGFEAEGPDRRKVALMPRSLYD